MKTISLEELHEHTAEAVEAAQHEKVTIMRDGEAVAVLGKASPVAPQGRWQQMTPEEKKAYWEEQRRELAKIPPVDVDSAVYISEDRDRW